MAGGLIISTIMDKNETQSQEDTFDIFAYLIVILKHKEFVLKITVAAMILAVIVAFLTPPTYQATTRIIPPAASASSMASSFAAQMGSMGISPSNLGVKTVSDLYVNLLSSKPVLDYVAVKMNLMGGGKPVSKEAVRRDIAGSLKVSDDKRSGMITIACQDRNPQTAADMANAFVEGLQQLNNSLAVTEASQRRLFFEEQLRYAKEKLIASEEALKTFQVRTGTIKIDDEAKAVIETVAKMRATLSAKEVEMSVMKSYATPQNADFQRLQEEIAALRGELYKFESKTRSGDNSVPNVGSISSMGTEYLRKMREFKYSESLYEILMKQYGVARLDESRDGAIIQIVEKAEAPERRIRPQRRHMVTRAGALAFFLSILFLLGRDYVRNFVSNPDVKANLSRISEFLDFSQLLKDFQLDKALNLIRRLAPGKHQ